MLNYKIYTKVLSKNTGLEVLKTSKVEWDKIFATDMDLFLSWPNFEKLENGLYKNLWLKIKSEIKIDNFVSRPETDCRLNSSQTILISNPSNGFR